MAVVVRPAHEGDLDAIRDLFNALIPTTTIAYREHLADDTEIAAWFAGQQAADFPVLVADAGGPVIGYATYGSFRGGARFPGYRHTAELTIHVDAAYHGRGVGRTLIDALVAAARARGIHVLVAGIDADNTASIEFHRRLGFVETARMPEVGTKFGQWLTLVLMQRTI